MSTSSLEQPLPAVVRSRTLPSLRLLPVPAGEPPYDDERESRELSLVRALVPSQVGPLRTLLPPPLTLVPAQRERRDADEEHGVSRTPVDELPSAHPVARALVQGLLEVLSGVRPVSQLQRGTSPELFTELEKTVHGRPRATGTRPSTGAVLSLHVQEQSDGVAEVCATVLRGGRAAAIALRLEGIRGRWCCTELAGL